MCWTICPKGFYADTTSNLCAICLSNMSCSACAFNNVTNTSYCTSCKYGYYFTASNNSCGTACLSTQYKNTWNNSCSSCDLSCSTCNGPTSFSCTSISIVGLSNAITIFRFTVYSEIEKKLSSYRAVQTV